MVLSDIDKFVYIGEDTIVCSKANIKDEDNLVIKYKINAEDKEIRLYDVPRILTFQEKSLIYYAILEGYYFYPASRDNDEYEGIENYVVKENGYSYHEFNQIEEENYGILGELLFEITRQPIETEKLSRIRDIYDLLIRNKNEIGIRPICIAFNGILSDFKDVYKTLLYMFEHDKALKKKKDLVEIFKRNGIFGGNKRIYIIPNKGQLEKITREEIEKRKVEQSKEEE